MQQLTFDSPDIIRKRIDRASKDHFALFDSIAEMANFAQTKQYKNGDERGGSWTGNHTWTESIQTMISGDLSGVAKSDELLAKMEQYELTTSRRAWLDDVTGAIPNVPAYIAGQPLNMRRRIKDGSAFAPIAIIADLSTSGAIEAHQVSRRGAAILALVRALAARRPVELWVTTGLDAYSGQACYITARIDTAPLDLSIAAHVLTHAGAPRNVFYGLGHGLYKFNGHWPYCSKELTRAEMEAVFAPAMPHVTETLCLPGIHMNDPSVTNPQAWLAEQIAQHAPVAL